MMKREPRKGLRPVTITKYMEEGYTGYFHTFTQEGSMENGMDVYAIIELEDGTVTQADAYRVKFDDIQ